MILNSSHRDEVRRVKDKAHHRHYHRDRQRRNGFRLRGVVLELVLSREKVLIIIKLIITTKVTKNNNNNKVTITTNFILIS